MSILEPHQIEVVPRPEIVIALAAAVGTPITHVQRVISDELKLRDYEAHEIRLSDLISAVDEEAGITFGSEYERILYLMQRGTDLRQRTGGGGILGVLAAAEISRYRPQHEEVPALDGYAFVLRQLKHPEEVRQLRLIYGDAFHLIGVYSPEAARLQSLMVGHGMSREQAEHLIELDEGEANELGQQLRDTFHLSDVFVSLPDPARADVAEQQIKRYFSLLFSDTRDGIITPTVDEYGMFLAYSASLRSADLSRQVGSALLLPTGEVLGIGCNEVPASGGGQYWPGGTPDGRDFQKGADSNALKKTEILSEVLEVVDVGFRELDKTARTARVTEVSKQLGPSRMMNLTEFGRAVHAEMEALLAAGRIGATALDAELYTTTFPCHNCAKHIVAAGVSRVVYIEPYPKSLAIELHADSMRLEDSELADDHRVCLANFVGVAPRRYVALFAMAAQDGRRYKRKDADGVALRVASGLRVREPALNYMQRENMAALMLQDFINSDQQEFDFGEES